MCAFLVAGAAVAWATGAASLSFVSSSGVVNACVDRSTGAVRIVDSSSRSIGDRTCRPTEAAVALSAAIRPANVTVDCAHGGSVQQALDQNALAPSIDITIDGTCKEVVTVAHNDVTLEAGTAGSGIQAPTSNGYAVLLNGASRVQLVGLTLSGGANTLVSASSASFYANNVTVTGAAHNGVDVISNSSGTFDGGSITGSGAQGMQAVDGGMLTLTNGTVVSGNGDVGVTAGNAANLQLGDADIHDNGGGGVQAFSGSLVDTGSGTTISNNTGWGVQVDGNSHADIGGTISGNSGGGIILFSSSSIHLQSATVKNNLDEGVLFTMASTGTVEDSTITDNTKDGIAIEDTSVVQFMFDSPDNVISGNGGYGVFCAQSPAVAMIHGSIGTMSGNAQDITNCPSD